MGRRQSVSAVQSDLFDQPDLAGLAQADAIITPSEASAAITADWGEQLGQSLVGIFAIACDLI